MSRVARIVPGKLFAQFLQLLLILREPFLLSISGLPLLLLLLCSGSRLAVPYLRADAGPMSTHCICFKVSHLGLQGARLAYCEDDIRVIAGMHGPNSVNHSPVWEVTRALTACCSLADISLKFQVPSRQSSRRKPRSGMSLSRNLQPHTTCHQAPPKHACTAPSEPLSGTPQPSTLEVLPSTLTL